MRSSRVGESTSGLEVLNISKHGLWLYVEPTEYFLPFDDFPWFRNATIGAILNVCLTGADHLFWPDLDVDLHINSLKNPSKYPLVQRVK